MAVTPTSRRRRLELQFQHLSFIARPKIPLDLADIRTLIAYSTRVRRRFLANVSTLRWEDVVRDREASYHSILGIMLHMIDNEDWIVNVVIPGRPATERRKHLPDEFSSFEAVELLLDEVEAKTSKYIGSVDSRELARNVKFGLSSGAVFDMTVEESLFQTFTEQLYHLGEIIALLWQDDVEPPPMQWFYNRESLKLSP